MTFGNQLYGSCFQLIGNSFWVEIVASITLKIKDQISKSIFNTFLELFEHKIFHSSGFAIIESITHNESKILSVFNLNMIPIGLQYYLIHEIVISLTEQKINMNF